MQARLPFKLNSAPHNYAARGGPTGSFLEHVGVAGTVKEDFLCGAARTEQATRDSCGRPMHAA